MTSTLRITVERLPQDGFSSKLGLRPRGGLYLKFGHYGMKEVLGIGAWEQGCVFHILGISLGTLCICRGYQLFDGK